MDVPDPELEVPNELDIGEEDMEVDEATNPVTGKGRVQDEREREDEGEDEEEDGDEADVDGEEIGEDNDDPDSEDEDLVDDMGESGDENDVEKIVDLMNDTLGYGTL